MKHLKETVIPVILLSIILVQTVFALDISMEETFGSWEGIEITDKMDGEATRVISSISIGNSDRGFGFRFGLRCTFDYSVFRLLSNNRLVTFRTNKLRMRVDSGEVIIFDEKNFLTQDNSIITIPVDDSNKIIPLAKKGRNILIEANIAIHRKYQQYLQDGPTVETFSLDGFNEAITWCNSF